MECNPQLAGRQLLCPTCLHRIVVPPENGAIESKSVQETWDTDVPFPRVETPTRYQ